MGSKVRIIIAQIQKIYCKLERCDLFYAKHVKNVKFLLVAEALTGLIYYRPEGEKSSFSQSVTNKEALMPKNNNTTFARISP